jgi:hypothetical protein
MCGVQTIGSQLPGIIIPPVCTLAIYILVSYKKKTLRTNLIWFLPLLFVTLLNSVLIITGYYGTWC